MVREDTSSDHLFIIWSLMAVADNRTMVLFAARSPMRKLPCLRAQFPMAHEGVGPPQFAIFAGIKRHALLFQPFAGGRGEQRECRCSKPRSKQSR